MPYEYIQPYTLSLAVDASACYDDLDVGSDVSDEDFQAIARDLRTFDVSSIKRPLAAATVKLQDRWWRYWESFCKTYHWNPEQRMRNPAIKVFVLFFEWYRIKYPRAGRVSSYETLWKGLRQFYYDRTQAIMPEEVGSLISRWLHKGFAEKHGLIHGWKPKHTVGHHTLLGLLHHHWTFDDNKYPLERLRVQIAAALLFLAYTGARPGAILESCADGIRKTNEALLYRDVSLKLLRSSEGSSLLVMEVTIRLDKGHRGREYLKTITLYENRQCPAMCPVIHFLALAFDDQAFHKDLLDRGLTPSKLHNFRAPDGRNVIEFKFRKDILDKPVFRPRQLCLEGNKIDANRALSAGDLNAACRRLGQHAGLPYNFTPYCLRREVGTELTDQGYSDQQRNQILGHARSETFLKHYISSNVVVDVQATYLSQESRSDLIKEMAKLTLRRDPNLPKRLSPEQKTRCHDTPELRATQQLYKALSDDLRNRYGCINNAPKGCPKLLERSRTFSQIQSQRKRLERHTYEELLATFHANADLEHMVRQLEGGEPQKQALWGSLPLVLPEREWLANNLFAPADDDTFAKIVDTMTTLCAADESARTPTKRKSTEVLEEPPSKRVSSTNVLKLSAESTSPSEAAGHSECLAIPGSVAESVTIEQEPISPSGTSVVSPKKQAQPVPFEVPRKACLFCYDPNATNREFARKDNLRRHYRLCHFQYQIGSFYCTVPGCETLIHDPDHFANHALTTHRHSIGVRASIMEMSSHKARPGCLTTFRL